MRCFSFVVGRPEFLQVALRRIGAVDEMRCCTRCKRTGLSGLVRMRWVRGSSTIEIFALPQTQVNKKASGNRSLEASIIRIGRCERIRTFDPLHPMQVRYQAAPHTDKLQIITRRQTMLSKQDRANHGFPVTRIAPVATVVAPPWWSAIQRLQTGLFLRCLNC